MLKRVASNFLATPVWRDSASPAVTELVRWMSSTAATKTSGINWVFLGPPGVGKGTYASRAASNFGLAHISTGDLIRAEVATGSDLGKKMDEIISKGNLLPDDMMLEVLKQHLEKSANSEEAGFILDGFPRTDIQAEKLAEFTNIQLVLNLSLRQEVLIEKCLGRRLCTKCGKNYNVADIYLKGEPGKPEIVMPPLNPPKECMKYMEQRADDTEEVIKKRLEVYKAKAFPVEDFYKKQGVLRDFEITGGIPETLPTLLSTLKPYTENIESAEMTG